MDMPMLMSCKRRRTEESSTRIPLSILGIPIFVLLEIFTKLPIAAILSCKRVCKAWYDLLSDYDFADAYFKKQPFTSLVVSHGNSLFSLLELNPDSIYAIKRNSLEIFRNPPEFSLGVITLVGSSNGMICFSHDYLSFSSEGNASVYISNPLLGEYALLPNPIVVPNIVMEAYGFGFSPKIGQYKVLRILRRKWRPHKAEAHVCTIGVDENWRYLKCNVPYPHPQNYAEDHPLIKGQFCEVNGSLHWIVQDMQRADFIYSFEIGEEKVQPVSPPPCLTQRNWMTKLGVLNNCLCVFHSNDLANVDIWWMTKYGVVESWIKEIILTNCIPTPLSSGPYYPIVIWRDGIILMPNDSCQLTFYNQREKISTNLKVEGGCLRFLSAVPYVPNFNSLDEILKGVNGELKLTMGHKRKRIVLRAESLYVCPTIQQLPTYILTDIFSRLPLTTIFQCKRVCRTWYNFISDPHFANTYFTIQPFINIVLPTQASAVRLIELNTNNEGSSQPNTQKVLQLPPRFPDTRITILGSCNGLICMSLSSISAKQCTLCLCNPLLQEYAVLPQLQEREATREQAFGFGFSSATGRYKVLRMFHIKDRPIFIGAQVHTIGVDKGWRMVAYRAPFPMPKKWPRQINKSRFCETTLNGAIHWMEEDYQKVDFIYSFLIGVEEFRPVPPPPAMGERRGFTSLGVLQDCLCVFHSSRPSNMDIWRMNEYGNVYSWTKESILRCYMPVGLKNHAMLPILSWRNGEILISVGRRCLVSYSPVVKRTTEVRLEVDLDEYIFTAITHYHSFLSLKAATRGGHLDVAKMQ